MSNNNENLTNQENNNNDLPVIENPTSSEQQQQENPPSPKKEENPKENNNTNPEIDNNIQDKSQQQEEEQQNDQPEIPSLPREKWVVLESLFQRNGIANKPTNFSLEVYGIYSVPEWWKKLENSGAVDAWGYQVRVGEALTINGKYNERELTDEEKLQAENKKKGPPKIDKKNPDAVKAEEERLAKIEEEKKQLENDFYNELNKLEPIDRFYKIKEIHNQADWISFDNEENKKVTVELKEKSLLEMEDAITDKKNIIIEVNKVPPEDENEKKRPKPKNLNPEDIKPVYTVGLADLTEFYIVPGTKELILRTPLMLKETYEQRIQNNVSPIVQEFIPTENDMKAYLFGPPVEEGKKDKKGGDKNNDDNNKKEENKENDEKKNDEQQQEQKEAEPKIELDYVEKAHTYVYYKLSFSRSINPKVYREGEEPSEVLDESVQPAVSAPPEKVENIEENKEEKEEEKKEEEKFRYINRKSMQMDEDRIKDSIKQKQQQKIQEKEKLEKEQKEKELKEEEEKHKPINAAEMSLDFKKYIKIFIAFISKNYDELMGDSSKNGNVKREKGTNILNNVKKEERDMNINKFIKKFIENGRANMIKEKLKKFITRIAIEKYKKRPNTHQNFAEIKENFFSELYAYISDEVRLGMDEYVRLKKDELHEHILSAYEQSRKEIMAYAIRKNKEPEEKKLLRLSKEYELLDELDKSMFYYKSRLTIIKNKESWLQFAILAKKMNNLTEVEEAIHNCIDIICDLNNTNFNNTMDEKLKNVRDRINEEFNLKIILSAIKYLKGRMKDAISYANQLIDKYTLKKTTCNFNAFLAFLYHEKGDKYNFTKHYEAAKRFKMLELGYNLKKPAYNPKVKIEYKRPTLPVEECDTIWYNLINFFNEYEFYEISDKLLNFITEENKSTITFKLKQAEINLFFKNYEQVIEICNEIISLDKKNYHAWILRGHAYHYLNNLFDSEESYVNGIRCKPEKKSFDLKMLTRLGLIYIRRKTWGDAKTVFLHILKDSVYHSFAWRYIGLALTELGDYIPAENALNESISLDIENPITWAYMTMFCILVDRKREAFECLNELVKMNFSDIYILNEIAQLFYKKNEYVIASNLYKRIIHKDKNYIDAYIKLAEIYFMKFDDNKKKEAVEILKKSLEFTKDEKEKNSIQEFINVYENDIGEGNNNMLGDMNDDKLNITGQSEISKGEGSF